jgi:nucleotide-binding universal stress UspA family protein
MSAPATSRRRIVVGVDGSAASLDALRMAARIAPVFDAELDAVIAWHYPTATGMAPLIAQFDPAADAATIMHAAIEQAFGDRPPVGLRQQRREGHPARVLLDAGAGAELLVVGSRGHGGFAGLLLGSVSAHCVEHATCPVLVVHAAVRAPTTDTL